MIDTGTATHYHCCWVCAEYAPCDRPMLAEPTEMHEGLPVISDGVCGGCEEDGCQ